MQRQNEHKRAYKCQWHACEWGVEQAVPSDGCKNVSVAGGEGNWGCVTCCDSQPSFLVTGTEQTLEYVRVETSHVVHAHRSVLHPHLPLEITHWPQKSASVQRGSATAKELRGAGVSHIRLLQPHTILSTPLPFPDPTVPQRASSVILLPDNPPERLHPEDLVPSAECGKPSLQPTDLGSTITIQNYYLHTLFLCIWMKAI